MNSVVILGLFLCVGVVFCKKPSGEIKLPPPSLKGRVSVEEALGRRRSVRQYKDEPLTLEEASQVLWAAQGITEKSTGFRAAPSAGATFPLEVQLVVGKVKDLDPGIYRYIPQRHALKREAAGDVRAKLAAASLGQTWIRNAPATIAISAVYERTTGHYGNRGRRYVDIEVGHAGENIYLQAEALGLATAAVGAFDDSAVRNVLGLNKAEEPLYLMPVGRH